MKATSFVIFIAVFSLILAFGALYIERVLTRAWRQLPRPPLLRIRLVRYALVSLIALQWITPFLYRSQLAARWNWAVTPVQWAGYLGLGFLAQLGFCVLVIDASRILPIRKMSKARREFFAQFLPRAAVGTATTLAATGLWQARRGPRIHRITIPIQNLARDLEGFKIAQISDLHVGTTIRRPYVEEVVQLTQKEAPDLIALTGDMIDGSVDQLEQDVAPLAHLEAKHGIYYVTGNHEYYSGAIEWIDKFRDLGARNLPNAHEVIPVGTARLLIAGVHDLHAARVLPEHRSDVAAAMANAATHDFALLLAHQPGSIHETEKHPVHLQLSGHTHGGQFFPINLIARFVHPYLEGLHEHRAGQWIYVNSGTGYWGPPNRLGTRAEISIIELRRAQT